MIIDPSVIRQVSREKDIDPEKMFAALEEAMSKQTDIVLAAQRDAKTNSPEPKDIYSGGRVGTIIQLRAPGMTWMRLPFFVWAQFVTAFLLLLAFPPLEAAAVLQLMDKVAHTSFFLPTGLAIGGNLAEFYLGHQAS